MSNENDTTRGHRSNHSDETYSMDVRLASRQAGSNWASTVEDTLIPSLRATTLEPSGNLSPTDAPSRNAAGHMLSTLGLHQMPDPQQLFPTTSMPSIPLDQSNSGSSSSEPSGTYPGLLPVTLPPPTGWQPAATDQNLYNTLTPATTMYTPSGAPMSEASAAGQLRLPSSSRPRALQQQQQMAPGISRRNAASPVSTSPDPTHSSPPTHHTPSTMGPTTQPMHGPQFPDRRMPVPMPRPNPAAYPAASYAMHMDPRRPQLAPHQLPLQMQMQQMQQLQQMQQMQSQPRHMLPRMPTPTPPMYPMSPIPMGPTPVMQSIQQSQTPLYFPATPIYSQPHHPSPSPFPATFLPNPSASPSIHPAPSPSLYPVTGPSPQTVVYNSLQALQAVRPDIYTFIDNGHRTELLRVAEISMPVAICIVHFYLAKLPSNWVEHLKVDNPARYLQRRIMQLGSYQLEAQLATQLLYLLHMRPDIAAAVDERTMNMLMGTKCMQSGVYRQLAMLLNEGMSPGWEQTVASPAAYLFTAIATIIREHLSETEEHHFAGM